MLGRLRDPAVRGRVNREIDERGLTSFGRIASWDAVSISTSRTRSADAGRSIAELARRDAGVEPIDLVCDLIEADAGATFVVVCSIDEADVQALLRSPAVLVGSDGRSVAPDSVAGQGRPHPRFYGTFPRVLGHYARDLGLLSLPEAVHKMTGAPARILGLAERGLLREGYQADITTFDPAHDHRPRHLRRPAPVCGRHRDGHRERGRRRGFGAAHRRPARPRAPPRTGRGRLKRVVLSSAHVPN